MNRDSDLTPAAGIAHDDLFVVLAIFVVGALGLVIGLSSAGRFFEAGLGALMVLFSGGALGREVRLRWRRDLRSRS